MKHLFQKGNKINLGRKHSEETKDKMRLLMIGKNVNTTNASWKGDKVGYGSLHQWIRKYLSIPSKCQKCGKEKKLDLCCVTGIYNRDFNNWKYLCRSCHMLSDGRMNNLKCGNNFKIYK